MLLSFSKMAPSCTARPSGRRHDTVFELVFNTSMTGYQEILTDPSYRGQAVLFTCSHIGNVGINLEDNESAGPQASAAVVCSLSRSAFQLALPGAACRTGWRNTAYPGSAA